MASEKILKQKQSIVEEIKSHIDEAASIVLFDYRGLTDGESKELRRKLKKVGADYKIYKNTLMSRAFSDLKIDLKDALTGPSALLYGNDQVAPIKELTKFQKEHEILNIKMGYIDGNVCDNKKLSEYANIPSRDGLLTMLAGGMIGLVKDLSICLDLYAQQKEEK